MSSGSLVLQLVPNVHKQKQIHAPQPFLTIKRPWLNTERVTV